MDNFRIDITSEGVSQLEIALGLAFDHAPGRKATHYRILPEIPLNPQPKPARLVFYWNDPGQPVAAQPFPFEMKTNLATSFAAEWLERPEPWGPQPDHDGDNGHGWRVFNEAWGHVDGSPYGIIAVARAWAMYGK